MRSPSVDRRVAARLAWGAFLGATPSAAVRVLGGQPTPTARKVVRVLGARHLLQSGIEQRARGRHRYLLASVDWAHAASGMALAALDRRWRRAALTDATVATAFGLSTARAPHR